MTTRVLPTRTAGEALLNALTPHEKKEPPRGQLTTWPAVREYIFAGKAVFSIRSVKTGMRLTYKVIAKKEDLVALQKCAADGVPTSEAFVAYFVNLLRGQDNTRDYSYLGVLRKPGNFFITPASRITRHPTSYKALVWFLDAMRNDRDVLNGKPLEFWHNGHCGVCGRLLTVPSSVMSGIGPVCDGRMG